MVAWIFVLIRPLTRPNPLSSVTLSSVWAHPLAEARSLAEVHLLAGARLLDEAHSLVGAGWSAEADWSGLPEGDLPE